MNLDVYLTALRPTQVLQLNITHNLTIMAGKVLLKNGQNLYQILWRANGWGNYTHLVEFVQEYLKGCIEFPD